MSVEQEVLDRIGALLEASTQLVDGNEHGQVRSEQHRRECSGWLTSAGNVLQIVCPDAASAYRKQTDRILGYGANYAAHDYVGELAAILRNLQVDINAGLLGSIALHAQAEVYDDFLDHAEQYAKSERKNEAGAIAGVVFEDTLRRVASKIGIVEKGVSAEDLINALVKRGVLSGTKAKRAKAAADVRTKATHARWDEFDMNDVKATIVFTREFISVDLE
jgi:hypothetical protein